MKTIGLILGVGLGIPLGLVAYFFYCVSVMKLVTWSYDYLGF